MSEVGRSVPPACAEPIDPAILMDYWLGRLDPSDEEPVEIHLLECDSCGGRLREVIELANGLKGLAQSASLQRTARPCRTVRRISLGEYRLSDKSRRPSAAGRSPA